MTLDEPTWREMARRDRERELAGQRADYEHERMMESVEAEEARWRSRWARQTAEGAMPFPDRVSPGVDRRMFAVDGDTDRIES